MKSFNLKKYSQYSQSNPKMMPGQTPYTEDEYNKLTEMYDDAVSDDPGEMGEDVYLREERAKDLRWVADQLTNAWEHMGTEEMAKHLSRGTNLNKDKLVDTIFEYYRNDNLRNALLVGRNGNEVILWLREKI